MVLLPASVTQRESTAKWQPLELASQPLALASPFTGLAARRSEQRSFFQLSQHQLFNAQRVWLRQIPFQQLHNILRLFQ